MTQFEVIRDPLWDNIRLEPAAAAAMDTPAVQRLRYVRQLGHAFLVYPGATHSRFEHALGAYHLTRRALATLEERGDLATIPEEERLAVRLAALLHDIGHYPFSHALEEAGFPSHEALGVRRLGEGELGVLLRGIGGDGFIAQIAGIIQGDHVSPLGGLISGSLDLDKIDYLSRDARQCGVPYGTVDVDRLLASLCLVTDGAGHRAVGVHEKGVSALESLLFAKYQMYRNVYWHHAVRSATCMFKRAVRTAVASGQLDPASVADATDGSLTTAKQAHDSTELTAAQQQLRALGKASVGSIEALQAAQPLISASAPPLPADVRRALDHPIVYVELDARPSRIPVMGPLITRLRIALHRIALHYVRLYAGKQNSLNVLYSQALQRMRDLGE